MSSEILTKTGKKLSDITLEAVERNQITPEDIKISRETLLRQRDVALRHNRPQLAENFERAAELVDVPDEVMLEMYNILRPYRATPEELEKMADTLLNVYRAPKCAALVRDAVRAYANNTSNIFAGIP
jgi:propanediol dehydratase small subunit